MNDNEKSVLLAKAMGWELHIEPFGPGPDNLLYIIPPDEGKAIRSFYYEDNMALAWRVHLWALAQGFGGSYWGWWDIYYMWDESNAQRLWLDKIVELLEANDVASKDSTPSDAKPVSVVP